MRSILILLICWLVSCNGFSQATKSVNDVRNVFDEKGDYYADRKEYKKAIVYYNMARQKDADNYYSVLRKAEAYQAMGLYDQAARCFREIFSTPLYVPNEFRLQYALLLLQNKEIQGFEKWMQIYNNTVHDEIHNYLSATDVRAKMYKDSSLLIVENENILNTPQSERAPFVHNNQVIFSSDRRNLAGYGSRDDYNLYAAEYLSDGHLGRLNVYSDAINAAPDSKLSIAINDQSGKIYVSRGTALNRDLSAYFGDVPKDKNSAVDLKKFSVIGMGAIGQPAFSSDGRTMYFVSGAPGGIGGTDIYKSQMSGGIWGAPENLGNVVNSVADELFPFLLHDSLLYFSSGGHGGNGGLDLFLVNLNAPGNRPMNLGANVNSPQDDYALTFSKNGLTGYFCSNRAGGFGKEDIYRLHMLDIKVKRAAYRFKPRTGMEDDKINLYLNDGEEYNIASVDGKGFDFGFLPAEGYKMVIRHENPLAGNIIYNTNLSEEEKQKQFLQPDPFHRTEIRLEQGMRYEFTAGMEPISQEYKQALQEMSHAYQGGSSTIDLTALAKELLLKEGEVYTIRFVPENQYGSEKRAKEITALSVNDQVIDVDGRSFFIMLPLDIEANFNIKTDLVHFEETYTPKKVGEIKVDTRPVIEEEEVVIEPVGFPILVNAEDFAGVVKGREIEATELTIIPGSMYILTFQNLGDPGDDPGVVIPLTKGVKYNLGTAAQSQEAYQQSIARIGGATSNDDGELIDISILSKELDIANEKEIVFSLMPARQFTSQSSGGRNVLTTLAVDGRKYFITSVQRLQVNLKLPENERVNIQTDLAYVRENFDPSTIAMNVDTASISTDIEKAKGKVITDPVFDVVVVNFALNDYSLRPDAKSIIAEKVIGELKQDSRLYVTIKGYTDPLGDAEYNERLSRNRAQTVKDFLISNGIGESRIRTFSYGETQALKEGLNWEDLSEEELKKHRKVEIVIYLPK